ncbi:MAG: TonB-dependent receptor plug domain-containing protein [Paludibacter sp.]|nr:TonB-dependent receptor plug domain-containing protein [Paludibacter sp.]MDD4198003.1 TonB-dependent receptor plug domain-containing protein [Paludibacter sp.]MDD4427636.1 TonB-dependent receptor plug domain-containing protein [Paludibacter sp.]
MRHILFALAAMFVTLVTYAQQTYHILKDTTDSNSIILKVQQIKEIDVRSSYPLSKIKSGSSGISVDVNELKKLPNLLGDSDPFKALQYMGGISQAGEASANMNVRGGDNDQNVILLNGCPVESPTHILGLFSIFNPDLIDQMRYFKSGIPSEYGGRLSSVIDIKNNVQAPVNTEIAGNLGVLASRISLKTSLNKDLAVYAALRMSYLGTVVIPMLVRLGINPRLAQNNFEFYDTNFGFNYKLSSATRLSGHFYAGDDKLEVSCNDKFVIEDNASRWGNRVGGVQLSHVFTPVFSMIHNLNVSNFYTTSNLNWLNTPYNVNSERTTFNYKSDFMLVADNHNLKTGLDITVANLLPFAFNKETNDTLNSRLKYNQFTDIALYFRDEWEKGPVLINAGIRAAVHLKHPDRPFSTSMALNELMVTEKLYTAIEPRFFSRWLLDEASSVKVSASKHFQFSNRVQLINLGLPVEIFVSASEQVKPSSLWHFSGGYFRSLCDNKWEFSVEAYYKSFANLLEYGGKLNDLMIEDNIEKLLYRGRAYAYGSEFMLRKNYGKFTGWFNYTLGWNFRQFDDINNGMPYLATNDRRHDMSLIGIYQINDKLSLSVAYVYATGSRLNLPRSWYIVDGNVVLEYSKHNSFVMPDYHRLDLSLVYKLPVWNKLNSELNISIYNVYNRANPFMVYYNTVAEGGNFDYKIKMHYLTPILPSLSWTFRF